MKRTILKKMVALVCAFTWAVTPIATLGWQTAPRTGQQSIVLKQTTNQFINSLSHTLCELLYECETSLAYWHSMQPRPLSYAIIRGPNGWLNHRTAADDIAYHIEVLREKQQQFAHALGTVHTWQKKDATLISPPELRTFYADLLSVMPEIAKGVTPVHVHDLDAQALHTHLTDTITTLPALRTELLRQLKPHLKPHHLIRNWVKYTIGITAAIAAGITVYQHQDALGDLKNKATAACKHFWHKHILIPLQNTRDILFGRKHYNVITQEAIEGDKRVLRESLATYLPKIMPDATQEKIHATIEHIITTKDSSMIKQDWDKQVSHWFANFVWDKIPYFGEGQRLGESTSLIMQVKDLQLSEATMAGQEAWEAQQLNAELFAIFPVMLTLYGAKKGYDALFHRKVMCKPLQKRLRIIDQLLNHYNHGSKELDTLGTGYLQYHTTLLQRYSNRIPGNLRHMFKHDIAQLQDGALTVEQKLRVIDQMYRQYAFLASNI